MLPDALVPQRVVVEPGTRPSPTLRGGPGRPAIRASPPGARRLRSSTSAPGPDGDAPDAAVLRERDQRARGSSARAATTPYPKDGINDHVVGGAATVNPAGTGTKAAAWYRLTVRPGETAEIRGSGSRPRAPGARAPRPPTPDDLLGRRRSTPTMRRPREARPTSSTPTSPARDATATDEATDHAPGVRRHALEQAVLRATTSPAGSTGDPGCRRRPPSG